MRAMRFAIAAAMLAVTAGQAQAAFMSFTSNPTGNSASWTAFVSGLGGQVNQNLNFDTHPTGALVPGFYAVSDGVTLTPTGDVNTVTFGAGPNQSNTSASPFSLGEGLHSASNYLNDGGGTSSLTISFDAPVLGAGLFVIDYLNPTSFGSGNLMSIAAFTGQNGTGTLIGVANSVNFNFQKNRMYFMGVGSSNGDIGSIVLRDIGFGGDSTGIDNVVFARVPVTATPEPTSLALAGFAGIGMAVGAWRRHRQEKPQAA